MHIEIPGKPQTKLRPRFSRHKGKVRTYDPKSEEKTTAEWQLKARMAGKKPLAGPLELHVLFAFECPNSRKRLRERYHSIKPDLDNLIKWICDVGNGILWNDDAQIVRVNAQKVYCYPARTVLIVKEIENGYTTERGLQAQEEQAEDSGTEAGCPAECVEIRRACWKDGQGHDA